MNGKGHHTMRDLSYRWAHDVAVSIPSEKVRKCWDMRVWYPEPDKSFSGVQVCVQMVPPQDKSED